MHAFLFQVNYLKSFFNFVISIKRLKEFFRFSAHACQVCGCILENSPILKKEVDGTFLLSVLNPYPVPGTLKYHSFLKVLRNLKMSPGTAGGAS